jgi:hypothetical protein
MAIYSNLLQRPQSLTNQTTQMGKSTDYGSMGLYLDILGSSHNGVLHNRNVHNKLLDMGTANLMIIEEWHAGGDELIQVDRMQ